LHWSALLGICALLFSGALLDISTLLLGLGVTFLVWHLGHNVPALLDRASGTLLLRYITGGSGALLD